MKAPYKLPLLLALVSALGAGCASFTVTDDALVQRTAAATGMPAGTFTISDRSDEGVTTRYVAKGKKGTFNCYVTGTVSHLGRTVSDAMCTAAGSSQATTANSDNALIREYNKKKAR